MLSPFLIPGMLFAAALVAAIGLHSLIVRARDIDAYGRDWTGQYRLRPSFFGAVLEELVKFPDGQSKWCRAEWPVSIEVARS